MKRRNLAITATASAMALGLTACTSGNAPDATPTYDKPVDLTMTVWTADETILGTYQELADEFRADNPELGELTIQTLPFEDYVAQLTIQLSGGDAADLGWVVESTTPAFVDSGALADISALKEDPDYQFDDIEPGLLSALEGPNGELYGYPFANTTHPIIYNKTAFEQAGLPTPLELYENGEWTWENLKKSAKDLVDAGVVTYGFDIPQFAYKNYALFIPFMKGFGADPWPGGNECGYASPESQETFEFVHSMVFDDKSYPGPGSTSSFPTGDTGMFLAAPSILNTLTDAGFEFDVVPQPVGESGELDPFLGQASMVAFSDGEAPELATRLLGYFTSEAGAATLQKYYVPSRKALLTGEKVAQLSPELTPEAAERSLLEPLTTATQIDYPVAYPELEAATRPVLDSIWQPSADIPNILEQACEAAAPILED